LEKLRCHEEAGSTLEIWLCPGEAGSLAEDPSPGVKERAAPEKPAPFQRI
jgi:hypothetical protein